jgi:hypothetical protein
LVGVPVVGDNLAGLGRADEINLYNAGGVLKDRLTYDDQAFVGTIRTNGVAGWPCSDAVGANDPFGWQFASENDSQSSYVSADGDLGSPGVYVAVACNAIPTGYPPAAPSASPKLCTPAMRVNSSNSRTSTSTRST